jgi:hypothetical protein
MYTFYIYIVHYRNTYEIVDTTMPAGCGDACLYSQPHGRERQEDHEFKTKPGKLTKRSSLINKTETKGLGLKW